MNELLYPIVEKVFIFLNQPANGTDEIISMFELRRAYMNFLGTIFTSSLQNILISESKFSLLFYCCCRYKKNKKKKKKK